MSEMYSVFELPIFRNSLGDWAIAIGISIAVVTLLLLIRGWVKASYARMRSTASQGRRVVFATSVTYETEIDQLERIPALMRAIVQAQAGTRFDRCHFAKHAAASLEFETVYYVLSPEYNRYMDIQQAINLRLHRELNELGVEFAYPTQKLYVVSQETPRDRGERPDMRRGGRQEGALEIVRSK